MYFNLILSFIFLHLFLYHFDTLIGLREMKTCSLFLTFLAVLKEGKNIQRVFSLAIQKIERLRKPQCMSVCLSVCMYVTNINQILFNEFICELSMISSINQKYIKNHTIFSLAIYKIGRLLAQMCLHSLVCLSQKIIRFKSMNSFLE